MNNTIIGFIVEDRIAFVLVIDNEQPEAESRKFKFFSNPTIVEITDLPYWPAFGTAWDGTNFSIPEGLDDYHKQSYRITTKQEESRSFAFVSNGICTGTINLMPAASDAINALLSNPTFLDITEMVKELDYNAPPVGWFVKNGKIVKD